MTQIATPLFISRNDIIKNSPLQGAIDADALLPFVNTAQIKYIKDLLGTVLYEYIGAQILAGTTASLSVFYQDLINEHIKNTLILHSVHHLISM